MIIPNTDRMNSATVRVTTAARTHRAGSRLTRASASQRLSNRLIITPRTVSSARAMG